MNYGALVFFAAFLALVSSWFGFVLTPQLQVGQMQQTNTLGAGVLYPVARSGLAQQGLQVYRANGCAYCHSQQVRQSDTVFDIILMEAGTNHPVLFDSLRRLKPGLSDPDALEFISHLPKPITRMEEREKADGAVKTINNSGGAKAQLWVVPVGADLARGWGKRRSLAEDFLYDSPVLPGSQRIGTDLANVGVRQPDPAWHLRHLYAPSAEVKGSTMPAYHYLFEKRKTGAKSSLQALQLPAGVVPEGYEIVPTDAAVALAAYMVSLRNDAPLFSGPFSVASAPPAGGATNAPADATGTNAVPGGATGTNAPAATPAGTNASSVTNIGNGATPAPSPSSP